jgi:hypothetical protein
MKHVEAKRGVEQEGAERTEKTTFDFLGSAKDPVAKLDAESEPRETR